ncbi:hypothetical protein BC835DRAFT_746505 [Cytidiella melzeri]|nr:hypothetical protein BC835DRAFT_746505 [Cytidiella melzeri]
MFAPPLLVSVGAFSLRPDWLASLRSTISQLVRGLYIFERSFRGNAFSHGIKPQASSRGHSLTANSTHTILPIRNLLAYRLPTNCSEREARDEWRDSVEGRSALWSGIPGGRKETIRGLLVYFESELLKRTHKKASIGKCFIAAAREFFVPCHQRCSGSPPLLTARLASFQ